MAWLIKIIDVDILLGFNQAVALDGIDWLRDGLCHGGRDDSGWPAEIGA